MKPRAGAECSIGTNWQMANSNAAFGLRPIGYRGVAPLYETVKMKCAYNASAMYKGDPVIKAATAPKEITIERDARGNIIGGSSRPRVIN